MKLLGATTLPAPVNLAPPVASTPSPTSPSATAGGFGDVLSGMMMDVDSSLRSAEQLSIGALTGNVPLQKVVETVVQAEQKIQLTTAVRDKIVSAYLELTRMQI